LTSAGDSHNVQRQGEKPDKPYSEDLSVDVLLLGRFYVSPQV